MSKIITNFLRIGFTGIFLVFTALYLPAQSQSTQSDSIWTFDQIRTDLDGDQVPDYIKEDVTVTGIANINSGILHEKFLQAFVQNDSSGISIFAQDIETPFRVGDSLVVNGYIDQYNGLIEVQVTSYSVHPSSSGLPAPEPLLKVAEDPANYLGMMAEGTGRVIEKGATFNGKYVIISLAETAKSIMVYVSNFHVFYEDFDFGILRQGDVIHVKGVITEYNPEFPERRSYKLFLRTPDDLEFEQLPRFYRNLILSAIGIAILFIVGWVFVLRYRVNSKTQDIQKSLKEKDTLLREIHHRVKNNLAIISGLIELQLGNTDSEEAKNALLDSQNRIHSIGLIHEKLYKTESLTDIDLGYYIKDLVEATHGTFTEYEDDVSLNFDLDTIEVDPDKVIPSGLLINELVVNAYKHAFKKGKHGELKITVKKKNGNILLRVSDNGPGLPDDFEMDQGNGLGTMLITSFSDQLNAKMNIETEKGKGTTFTFTFPQS
ncbi:sensor histidine kinase [Gracilimonas sp. Q87]|uniref:sensor histidine kinase n=1 Tax=Gracilimonas sp. Q87 TaxID=3384766 RepID=UPI0039843F72